MSDTIEKAPTAESSSTSAETSVAGEKREPISEKKSWGDVEDDDVEEASVVLELNCLSLEEEEKRDSVPDEPEDSDIEVVTFDGTVYTSASRFEDLNLSDELIKGLYVEMRFEKPSNIQAKSLPMIMTPPYKHLIAQAHNGSGKTTCFVLGMLSRVDPTLRKPQALCICSIKSYRREVESHRERIKKNAPIFVNTVPITFTAEDAADLYHPHNDPLVVELIIYESMVTKVLIDTGSSVNVMFKGVLKEMEFDLRSVNTNIQPLTGFDGDTIMTVGTATFPIYVGGTMTWFDFAIVDKLIIYNVILGTPWIHRMKAVASTYHQCVKFPTARGIFTLRGDQMVARTCFMIERKLRYAKSSLDLTTAEPLAHSDDQTLMELHQP